IYRKTSGETHSDTANCMTNLAGLYAASGRVQEALLLLRRAANIDDQLIGQVCSVASERQRLIFIRSVQDKLDGFLSLVCGSLRHSSEAVRVALDLVLRRKAVAAEALSAQRDAILGGRYPHLREALQHLTRLRKQITDRALVGPRAGENPEDHQRLLT